MLFLLFIKWEQNQAMPDDAYKKYTVLQIQFRSGNDTFVARICKNVEQKTSRIDSDVLGESNI